MFTIRPSQKDTEGRDGGGGCIVPLYAHSARPGGEAQRLGAHLRAVAELAAVLAARWDRPGSSEAARAAGMIHDIGKATTGNQRYLLGQGPRPEGGHSLAGAAWLLACEDCRMRLLALVVAGHHTGLPALVELRTRVGTGPEFGRVWEAAAREVGPLPTQLGGAPDLSDLLVVEFWLRMVFSCLVDGDRLDTEGHFHPERAQQRRVEAPSLGALAEQLTRNLDGRPRETPIDAWRHEMRQDCERAAPCAPGFFRLTLPTGGGKTLSGLSFALRHALCHGLGRVIVALPLTTVTEQTAEAYREVLGAGAVLEHHSRVDPGDDHEAERNGLLAENWDVPIVVTTHVRLFESMFSNLPADCRRLHQLARAVVIIDEAQALPPRLVQPLLAGLRELVDRYGTTVVLCTATQPALEARKGFAGLVGLRDIVPAPGRYFQVLRRVEYDLAPLRGQPWPVDRLAAAVGAEPQVLVVLNTRRDAAAVYNALAGTPGAVLLSADLCPAHRQRVLAEVKRRLEDGTSPCRVVSTQLVEAGVDIDFPVVFRAVGPLDAIVQAAGRCNREWRRDSGRVVVFCLEGGALPSGDYETATAEALRVLQQPGGDLHDPAVFGEYFRRLYDLTARSDASRLIAEARKLLDYPTTARRSRLVEDEGVPLVVLYGESGAEVERARREVAAGGLSRGTARRLQRYTVSTLRPQELQRYEELLEEVAPGLRLWKGGYDAVRGLVRPADPGKGAC